MPHVINVHSRKSGAFAEVGLADGVSSLMHKAGTRPLKLVSNETLVEILDANRNPNHEVTRHASFVAPTPTVVSTTGHCARDG